MVLIQTRGFVCHCFSHCLALEENKLGREQWGGAGRSHVTDLVGILHVITLITLFYMLLLLLLLLLLFSFSYPIAVSRRLLSQSVTSAFFLSFSPEGVGEEK